MIRIRQGNDLTLKWDIYRYNDGLISENPTGSIAEDLTNALNIVVSLGVYGKGIVATLSEVTVDVNLLTIQVPKEDTPITGKYYVILDYDKTNIDLADSLQHYRLDSYAFDLVLWNASADNITDIAISSQLVAGVDGINGKSAYELAVYYEGFTGTVEEYLIYLRQPATDAKTEVDAALADYEELKSELETGEENRISNEQARVTSESGRVSAEAARVSAESGRTTSEQARVNSEQARVTAETTRSNNETTRSNNEATRITNETARGSAETSRVSAESGRVTNETTRGTNETARTNAEAARITAETARNTAENTRGTNESNRVTAENARVTAETTRGTNETARIAAEASRVTAEQARETFIGTVSGRIVTLESTSNTHTSQITELERKAAILYGAEFTRGLDPAMTRWIGDAAYQSNHFILDMFKVAKVKDGAVTGYLNQTNWLLMEDGTASNIIIDGTIVTDDGSDIMLVNSSSFYAILGGTNEVYERRIVGKAPFMYDGDVSEEIPAHGVCVDFSVIKSGKQRCIRDNTLVGTGGAGINLNYLADGLGCIASNVSRFNYELYARAKNVDTSKNIPYCNNFWLDIDVWHTLLCIKFKTKDYHNNSICGKAISSNDATPTVANWGTQTGVRVTNTGGTYSYYQISSSRFSSGSGVAAVTFWILLNNNRPLLKMLEAQLALSYAKANNIAANTDFVYDGATYSYVDIAGHSGLSAGEMTARVRKTVTVSFTGYDVINAVAVTDMPITYLLESVIIKGRQAGWGHLYRWNSGLDCTTDNTNYTFYQTTDLSKITTDTDVAEKSAGENFAFETEYDKIGSLANGESWTLRAHNNSLFPKTIGGGLHTAECFYSYRTGTGTAGKKARKGVYFGAVAFYGSASLRICSAYGAPSSASTYVAGGFRVAL